MRGEKWRHLRHVGYAADGPAAYVLVKGRRPIEHSTVRRHAAHGMRKKERRKDTPLGHNTQPRGSGSGSGSTSECVMC